MSCHVLICGVTMSGKTTLAREFAQKISDSGGRVVVRDPVGTATANGDWPAEALVFSDDDEFLNYIERDDVNDLHLFVDEAADIFNISRKNETFWMLTRGRHFGIWVYVICQRPKMVAPSVRSMCGVAYVFRLALDDLKEITADFGHNVKDLKLDEKELDKGDFLILKSGSSSVERYNVFNLVKRGSKNGINA